MSSHKHSRPLSCSWARLHGHRGALGTSLVSRLSFLPCLGRLGHLRALAGLGMARPSHLGRHGKRGSGTRLRTMISPAGVVTRDLAFHPRLFSFRWHWCHSLSRRALSNRSRTSGKLTSCTSSPRSSQAYSVGDMAARCPSPDLRHSCCCATISSSWKNPAR